MQNIDHMYINLFSHRQTELIFVINLCIKMNQGAAQLQ